MTIEHKMNRLNKKIIGKMDIDNLQKSDFHTCGREITDEELEIIKQSLRDYMNDEPYYVPFYE